MSHSSTSVARYSFLPWLRHGTDSLAIVRTEPRDGVRDFASNLLPFIEFYGEDLPWRHTPRAAGPETRQLTPWLTLVVLERDEFSLGEAQAGALPIIEVREPARVFPRSDQLWAWAHVHVNRDLSESDGGDGPVALGEALERDGDMACSRLLCPRQLRPDTDYWAFVVPSFERERLAGLGLDPALATYESQPAWGRESNGGTAFPYYHTWQFRSGRAGDFESLVRRLVPRKLDARVGVRELDVRTPGLGLDGIADPPTLALMGALRASSTRPRSWPEMRPDLFQVLLAELLNRHTRDRIERVNGVDPVITPPIYARCHAETEPLDARERNWVNQLNLDPRRRVAAGLGAAVVQANRDAYVSEAERQLGDVLAVNRARARRALAREVSWALVRKHIAGRAPESSLPLLAPVQSRVLWDVATTVDADAPLGRVLVAARDEHVWPEELGGQHGGEQARAVVRTSVAQAVADSAMSPTLFSTAFRKLTRARGPLMRRVAATGASLLTRANEGEITATPDKRTPTGAMTYTQLREHTEPAARPRWLTEFGRDPVLQVLVVLMLLFLLVSAYVYVSMAAFVVLAAVDVVLAVYVLVALRRVAHEFAIADSLALDSLTPEWAEHIDLGPELHPRAHARAHEAGRQHAGRVAVSRWRRALVDFHAMFEDDARRPKLAPTIDLASLANKMQDAISPLRTIPSEVASMRAHPVFEQPMVEALVDMSPQWLLPNIERIPANTVARVEVNHAFIESYMIGLNHEIVRELSWREFPMDRRATCFRQFWAVDRVGELAPDIPPLATWPLASSLGSHMTHRAALVLVIRGELLAQHPNAVICAQRAEWDGGEAQARRLAEHGPDRVRYPVHAARIAPDLAVVGFELSVDEARGDDDDPGWFLVFEQRPGEPSFGLATGDGREPPSRWRELSWAHVEVRDRHICLDRAVRLGAPDILDPEPERVDWSASSSAADIAYITCRDAVCVAVHAADLLPS